MTSYIWSKKKKRSWHHVNKKRKKEELTRLFPYIWVWTREGGRLTTTISLELILEREREMEGERGTVCVTGGTGYLASCLIMKLLEQGYSVNTTVRPHPGKFSIYFLGWGGGGFRGRGNERSEPRSWWD